MRKKKLIRSSIKGDDYFKTSNSNNHSQFVSSEEFAIEEDMIETQSEIEDVQIFNTQNFYNRQHYVGNRVVPVNEIDDDH